MRLWWIKKQYEDFLLVSHDVMISAFKFGGDRSFPGVDTTNFVWCSDSTRAIPVPCRIPALCQIRYKLRYLYGPHPTSALPVNNAIQKFQGGSISINKTRNAITLAHAAPQASTRNTVGVSCNCKGDARQGAADATKMILSALSTATIQITTVAT